MSVKYRITLLLLIVIMLFGFITESFAAEIPLSLFPMQRYDQNVDAWLDPKDPNYKKPLLSKEYQQARLKELYNHYFSTEKEGLSPWSENYVSKFINKKEKIVIDQKNLIKRFGNVKKEDDSKLIGFGENYRPHEEDWIIKIANNIDFEQLTKLSGFKRENCAILVQNTAARALPTALPHYYSFKEPGQGYPFDNLQVSAIWAGTPLYILSETKDKSWSLVLAPEFVVWVQTKDLARVDKAFISEWQKKAKAGLAAITVTETSIRDAKTDTFQFKAYVGSFFPMQDESAANQRDAFKLLIPVKDPEGKAKIRETYVTKTQAARMPMEATPENFAKLFKTLQKRPYGWGGSNFNNDCSQELKSIYATFGIWLPRNSLYQANAGRKIDKSDSTIDQRLESLRREGRPLVSLIYIDGHVMMYLGKYTAPDFAFAQRLGDDTLLMTYQNIWGLRPKDDSNRAVIGQAVFIPLLKLFPEGRDLDSQANKKRFMIIHLDEWPDETNQDIII